MIKTKHKSAYLYEFYFFFYSGSLWGLGSYFTLAYLYFTFDNAVLFWIPALTIFLPATIALTTQVSEGISTTLFLSALYGIFLSYLIRILLKKVMKIKKKPRSKKRT